MEKKGEFWEGKDFIKDGRAQPSLYERERVAFEVILKEMES